MNTRWRHKVLLAALLGAAIAAIAAVSTPAMAQASSPRRGRRPGGINRDKGPAETRQERDARLRRECRGKPNSGACEGYGG